MIRETLRNQLVKVIGALRSPAWKETDEPTYRILTYHRIKPDQRLAFQYQLRRLDEKYNILTPGEFTRGEGDSDELNLLLTFDDGYLEWESFVRRELNERNLRAVFFVCPDFVEMEGEDAEEYCREHIRVSPASPLTSEGVHRLLDDGHTVGNHLVRHTDLRDERNGERMSEVFRESQRLFSERFDRTPDWVAYPFGDYFTDETTLREQASDHFEYGVTLRPGFNTASTSSLYLHRDGFSPEFGASLEEAWLTGGFDPIHSLTHLFKPG